MNPRGHALQRGSFMLEALIALLIVALGILGLVGLQARAVQNIGDAQYRSEAAFLSNDLLSRMWTSNQANLVADFESTGSGTPYDEFKTIVQARLPKISTTPDPDVTVTARFGDPTMGHDVVITVFWQPPGDLQQHRYQTGGTVKLN